MNELQMVEALEPYVTELLDALKRLDAVEKRALIPGDPGKDADLDEIVARLRADPLFRGRPGKDVDTDETVARLKADVGFVDALKAPAPDVADLVKELVDKYGAQLKGDPGKDAVAPTAHEIASELVDKFAHLLKGEPGKDADEVDPLEVAKALTENETFVELVTPKQGEPGKDADPVDPNDVAKALLDLPEFIDKVKGEPGKDVNAADVALALLDNETFKILATAEPGQPGADADPAEVAKALLEVPEFVELVKAADAIPGDPGKDSDAAEVAAVLRADEAFVASLKGEPGVSLDPLPALPAEHGKDGADGAGIHAAEHEPNKVYREGVVVTAYIGQYYRAKCDTAQTPGESDDWARVGTAGFRWRGLKPEEKSLTDGDLYIDGGSMFGVFAGKASMVVQRPKSAPVVKSVGAKNGQLVLRLSDGSEVVGELPVAKGYTLTVERLEERILVLDDALAKSEAAVAKLTERLLALETYISERDE